MDIIERMESRVRSYCRSFPTVFDRAEGEVLYGRDGRRYLDFFAGAGALNYGHNDPVLRDALVAYLARGGVAHALDMATAAKCELLETLDAVVLRPRGLEMKAMFPGPTGTNAVEAALKLARKVTGRTSVVAFTNAFHGMTLGSLAVTGNAKKRGGAGVPLANVTRAPFDGYFGPDVDTLDHLEALLADRSAGLDRPAAFIVETVQAEGGVNVASEAWLRRLAKLAREHGALLIIDDIQVGCGRTGPFFSFEPADIRPDVICLSKSLSGFGLPFALTLFRPDLDQWTPGEHNGTFRGNNLAFVTARAALDHYWRRDDLSRGVAARAKVVEDRLDRLAARWGAERRGRGLIQGLAFGDATVAGEVSRRAFEKGLIIETAGADDEVLKLLPPLTIPEASLARGLDIIESCVEAAMARREVAPAPEAVGGEPEDWRAVESAAPEAEA